MKRIGLIGGVSPESTVIYYRLLNAAARQVYGGDHSANVVVFSLDFGEMHALYRAADWSAFRAKVVEAGRSLEAAGCALIAITSNTVQLAADDVAEAVDSRVIHLMDPLKRSMEARGASKPLLLGTPVVMEGPFYRSTLRERYGIETTVPNDADREIVNRVIFDELVEGDVRDASRDAYLEIIERGRQAGSDCAILGCTEIGMLIEQSHLELPVFDTTRLHAAAIAQEAFANAPAPDGA